MVPSKLLHYCMFNTFRVIIVSGVREIAFKKTWLEKHWIGLQHTMLR